uniref:ANK_REP_REGION domain-containing protein n=1 Tax=Globodera pallida TaxID=36090 RepID=A0A183BQX3_GLOPA
MSADVGISNHLDLLRKEYVRLQVKHAELQRSYDVLSSINALDCAEGIRIAQNASTSNFLQRLLHIVTQLYDKDLYSDITIHVDGHQLRGHRIVIAARTDFWGDLSTIERLELTEIPCSVAKVMMKWIYTNFLDEKIGDAILMPLLEAALKYRFEELKSRCEEMIIARIDVENCVGIYQFAELNSLDRIRDFCAEVVSARWSDFTPAHFADMPAQLLYRLLKRKSSNLLGSLIRLQREDILFLFLIENDARLKDILNEFDCAGQLPLDIAFESKQLKTAKCLVLHGADLNKLDGRGNSFLWKAIRKGNVEVCDFLIENGTNLDYVHEASGDTLLHVLAKSKMLPISICQWVPGQISHFDVNALDRDGKTPLIVAIEHENIEIIVLLLQQSQLDINKQDKSSRSALEIALLEKHTFEIAKKLITIDGLDLGCADKQTGQTLLHKATASFDHIAIQFLATNGVAVDVPDAKGSTPLHQLLKALLSDGAQQPIEESHLAILRVLLQFGADPSLIDATSGCSSLHYAVSKPKEVLEALLTHCEKDGLGTADRDENSPLWCALMAAKFDIASLLIGAGADINEKSAGAIPLLIKAIAAKRDDISKFLLANKAIAAVTSPDGFTPLNLAVQNGLTSTVDQLCKLGANLNHPNPLTGLIPLWTALENEDFGTAEVLTSHGADTEGLSPNDEQTLDETLLHRAIDKNNQKAAVFLIKSGCNVNALRSVRDVPSSRRKHSPSSNLPDAAFVSELYARSKQTPLHTAVQWGLTEVARALISNLNCRIDAQDADGRTAAHIAVLEQDQQTLELLLSHPDPSSLSVRDRYGHTPLALAMRNKHNKMAEAICKRLPHAALQMNGSGENLLHCAIKSSDLESVLFLLGIHIDVNIPTQDQERNTALHICSRVGDELILRNLILAGAEVNMRNANGQSAVAIATMHGHVDICRALLENGADPNIANEDGNNALHAAVSRVASRHFGCEQTNILHLCAINIGHVSVEAFAEILKAQPNYPLETADMFGNTMFLLAFINGNSELCKLALRNGACMGVMNNQGQTVFNFSTPTQQLLFGLLESLEREPKWAEGDSCSECVTKFTLTMRKHHCRHCGRLVCAKCSDQQIPILKYNLAKTVRVCEMCYGVLTMGAPPALQRA